MSGYLRIWLRVPPSFSLTGLYSHSTQCRISVSTVLEEFTVAKCRLVMTLKTQQMAGSLEQNSNKNMEESGQQKHQWTNYLDRSVKEQFRISFLLRSVFDNSYLLQPCKSGNKVDPTLKLCEKRELTAQILSVWQVLVVLTQERYNRRFDKVLRELADVLEVERKRKRPSDTK